MADNPKTSDHLATDRDVYGRVVYNPRDIEQHKLMAALSYILFFLPLIVCPKSPYARFHANQGLIFLVLAVVGSIFFRWLPMVGSVFIWFWLIIMAVVFIMQVLAAWRGDAKEIPLAGKIRIFK